MEYVYTSFVFLLSTIEAVLFYYVVCRRKLAVVTWKRLIPLPILYLAMILCVVLGKVGFFQTVIIIILYYAAGCIFTQTGWIENIKYWLLSLFLSSAVEQIIYQTFWRHLGELGKGYGFANVLTCVSTVMLLLVLNKLCGRKDTVEIQFPTKIFLILTPAAGAVVAGISYMAYVVDELDSEREKQLTLYVLLFAIVGVCIVIIMILHILRQREGFRMKAELEKQYNQQQRAYFALLLQKEEETRRFRHDIVNHFICLQDHIRNQRYDDAEGYLKDILAEMDAIREMQYNIGNEVVNVLLNYYLIPIKEKCSISLDGCLGKLEHISQMESLYHLLQCIQKVLWKRWGKRAA